MNLEAALASSIPFGDDRQPWWYIRYAVVPHNHAAPWHRAATADFEVWEDAPIRRKTPELRDTDDFASVCVPASDTDVP
jgi:hypothetical protein